MYLENIGYHKKTEKMRKYVQEIENQDSGKIIKNLRLG
jgi:hypothetical protein